MKKLLCILIVLILSLPAIAMAEIDWKGLSVEEIQAEINKARAEIHTREIMTTEKETIILDADGLVVSITKIEIKKKWDDTHDILIYYTVVNNSNKNIGFCTDKAYLNGWDVSNITMIHTLDAGMKARKDGVLYSVDIDADVNSYDDLEELRLVMHTFDADTFWNITENIDCTIYFK